MLNEAAQPSPPTTTVPIAGGLQARYVLQPGLTLTPTPDGDATAPAGGGSLFSARPLLAMRLNPTAFALVTAVSDGPRSACEAAAMAGVSPREAAAFLDRLTARRLLLRLPPTPSAWPEVSIIVAARDRHASTRACIRSLLTLDYPETVREIIVVDDASEPPLAPALDGLPIRIIRLDRNLGQSAARNLAATEATGEILAFIDNDCLAAPDWLATLVPHLADGTVGIVGGRVIAPPASGRVAAFEAVRSPLDMGVIGGPVGPVEVVAYLPTCNFLIRRDIFLAVGGFMPEMRLGEDVDLTWRALAQGTKALYVPAGQVTHHHRNQLDALLRRRADYGSSEADLQRRHPAAHRVLQSPRLVLLALLTITVAALSWPLAAALGLAVTALLVAEAIGKRRRIGRIGVSLPLSRVFAAVLREHGASLHGLSADIVRYYGLPLLLAALLVPALWPAAAVLALTAPLVDHRRLRPACGPAIFVGLTWLELAAYQLGVWRGCIARRTFAPLLPIVHWRR
jgi:mycofactocin system glycosyltransferase